MAKYQEAACKDPKYAFLFARDIKGADIKYCQEAAYKYPVSVYYFAKRFAEEVYGAN